MRKPQITPPVVMSLAAMFVTLGGSAWAATGDPIVLGQPNTADHQTALAAGAIGGAALKVTNTANQPAASFTTPAGIAPLAVSNSVLVPNLNADTLDGTDSTRLLAAGGKAADSDLLDGQDSSAFLGVNGKAADSSFLDGLAPGAFLAAGATAQDADKLDGLDSTAFLPVGGKAADTAKLDGIDSTGLVHGNADVLAFAQAIPANTLGNAVDNGAGIFFRQFCPQHPGTDSDDFVQWINESGETVNLFVTNDGAATPIHNTDYFQFDTANGYQPAIGTGPSTLTFQVQGIGFIQLTRIAWVGRASSNDCHMQGETYTWHF